jgi:peroxiredoxin
MLAPGDRLPALTLPTADGDHFVLDAPGRDALVLILVHDTTCDRCRHRLHELAAEARQIQDEEGRAVVVLPDGDSARRLATELDLPFPVLIDAGGLLRERLGVAPGRALSAVADRYGEVWDVAEAACTAELPEPTRLETALRHIAIQCPECGFADSPVGPFAP